MWMDVGDDTDADVDVDVDVDVYVYAFVNVNVYVFLYVHVHVLVATLGTKKAREALAFLQTTHPSYCHRRTPFPPSGP